jgi:hypothetical protein
MKDIIITFAIFFFCSFASCVNEPEYNGPLLTYKKYEYELMSPSIFINGGDTIFSDKVYIKNLKKNISRKEIEEFCKYYLKNRKKNSEINTIMLYNKFYLSGDAFAAQQPIVVVNIDSLKFELFYPVQRD